MTQSISDHLTSMREMFNHVPKIGVTLRGGFRSSSLNLSEQFDFDCKCNAFLAFVRGYMFLDRFY